jgi:hypothetical protein
MRLQTRVDRPIITNNRSNSGEPRYVNLTTTDINSYSPLHHDQHILYFRRSEADSGATGGLARTSSGHLSPVPTSRTRESSIVVHSSNCRGGSDSPRHDTVGSTKASSHRRPLPHSPNALPDILKNVQTGQHAEPAPIQDGTENGQNAPAADRQ